MTDRTNKIKYNVPQLNPFDIYLKENGLTKYKLHQYMDLPKMTFTHVARKSIGHIETRFIIAIAQLLHRNPGEVLNEMLEKEQEVDQNLLKLTNEQKNKEKPVKYINVNN